MKKNIYAPGLLTIIVKVLLVPYAMLRLVSKLADERELISEINVNYSTAASAVFLVQSFHNTYRCRCQEHFHCQRQ